MQHSFVCPECRAVHDDPARASFTLEILCLDCELTVRYYDDVETLFEVAAAA